MTVLKEFELKVDECYGIYLDATIAFSLLKAKFELLNPDPSKFIHIGKGDPNLSETYSLHSIQISTFLSRNSIDGLNYIIIGNLCLVMIYQLWEDHYRQKLAQEVKLEKNDIASDLFHEINKIRQAIVHNNGLRTKKLDSLSILSFLSKDKVEFDEEQFEMLINEVKKEIKRLEVKYY